MNSSETLIIVTTVANLILAIVNTVKLWHLHSACCHEACELDIGVEGKDTAPDTPLIGK